MSKTEESKLPAITIKRGTLGTIEILGHAIEIPIEDVTISTDQVSAEVQNMIKTAVDSELKKLEHSNPENPKTVEEYPTKPFLFPPLKERK